MTYPWLVGKSYNNFLSILYGSTHRTLWSMSLAYILFSCVTGHGGVFNTIMSWKVWAPLSRLSFQAYLFQYVLIIRFLYEAQQLPSSIIDLVRGFLIFVSNIYILNSIYRS